MDPTDYISLVSPLSRTTTTSIGASQLATVQIVASDWGTAEVRMVWSLNGNDWVRFKPDFVMDASTTGRERVAVSGPSMIALEIKTADGAADTNAAVYLKLTKT